MPNLASKFAGGGQRELHHKMSMQSAFSDSSAGPSGYGGGLSSSPYGTTPPSPLSPTGLRPAGVSPKSALKTTSNMDFNPIPTTPGKSSKLSVEIWFDSTIFVAGGTLHGRMRLTSTAEKSMRLGEIAVELNGYEEVTDKDYARSQAFLTSRIVFQGERMPPSNAVRGPAKGGYWQANKGKTTFPFAFRLPADAPSSYSFQNLANLRYLVTGVVQYQRHGKSDSLIRSKEAFVVESWSQAHSRNGDDPVRARNHRRPWFSGGGEVHIEGTIQKSCFTSGSDVYVELRVRNESRRRVQGIKLALVKKLLMLKEGASESSLADTKIVSATVNEKTFKEKDFVFDAGEERANIININIPPEVYTCKNTALAEVACRLVLSLNMGAFIKDLVIELPITVCHSASILPPPVVDMHANQHPQDYNVIPEDSDSDTHPTIRTKKKYKNTWKNTLRARSASPPRTLRGGGAAGGLSPPPPQGRRALPWSDDEGDVQEFVTRRRNRNIGSVAARAAEAAAAASPPAGGFLRDLAPNSPAIATLRGRPSKGTLAKSPPIGPATPVSYVPAAERSKYLTVNSRLLHVPGSPTQETLTPMSPQDWADARSAGPRASIDPLALPSPVIKGRRAPLATDLYEPPSPTNASPPNRDRRPLPNVPPAATPSSPPTRAGQNDMIPIQYLTKSPPLKPRPLNYIAPANREPKPLPSVEQLRGNGGKFLAPDQNINNTKAKRGSYNNRYSAQSQVSTILKDGTESNFLDFEFDFGEDILAPPHSRVKGKNHRLAAIDIQRDAERKENMNPMIVKRSPPMNMPAPKPKGGGNGMATSPRGISAKLEGYIARYEAANGL
ncbi:hypothetical protein BDZ88DRAFT_409323 [Geranomyces variabilis]|nr:hypothetical protein BDZ88DRAFT_409323 [Geranomyces variabilis]KAJ3139820.1 hypothetical protein HDU90_008712 [Geranomyces variabilis]